MVPDEPGTEDGKHTRYLKDSPKNLELYRSCDPGLYDSLRDIVCGDRRNVSAIRQEEILPSGTVFFEEPLAFDDMPASASKSETGGAPIEASGFGRLWTK